MKPAARRDEIADYIMRAGQARIDELVEHFGVSRMTIHRHIEQLAQQGMLRKLHGMVTVQPSGLYEAAFRYRATVGQAEKQALAQAAMAYVEPGQAILLDDSSTACVLAELLVDAGPLTVVTNSLVSANLLAGKAEIDLISLGGRYHPTYQAFIGPTCEKAVMGLRVNTLFCSASAVQGTTGFIQDGQVTQVKQAMMTSAVRRILLLDHGKFGKVALNVLADLTAFDVVLITDGLEPKHRQALETAGVAFQLVQTHGNS